MTTTTQKTTYVELNSQNIKDGLRIVNTAHPEWGVFTVATDRNGWIRGNGRGNSMLDEGEFGFWIVEVVA